MFKEVGNVAIKYKKQDTNDLRRTIKSVKRNRAKHEEIAHYVKYLLRGGEIMGAFLQGFFLGGVSNYLQFSVFAIVYTLSTYYFDYNAAGG